MSERKSKTGFTKLASSQNSPYPNLSRATPLLLLVTYFLRTLPDITYLLAPLEHAGDIWSFDSCHHRPPGHYRRTQSTCAPSTYGGTGPRTSIRIIIFLEYEASVTVTEPLLQSIVAQDHQPPDAADTQSAKSQAGAKKNEVLKDVKR